jgi:hydrogenase maturation protease
MTPVVVFCCGEPLRGDDGVSVEAAAQLAGSLPAGVTVQVVGALSPSELLALPPGSAVVIADAVTGVPPGELVVLDLADLDALSHVRNPVSSHRMPLDRVIGLAGALGRSPRGTFVGVGVQRVGAGAPMTDAVAAAVPALAAAIVREARRLEGAAAIAR